MKRGNRAWGGVEDSAADAVLRRLYISMAFFFTGATAGAQWDRWWHWNNPPDSFGSAPHVFMYTMALFSAASAATIAFSPRYRAYLGAGKRLPLLHTDMPFPLLLLGSGLACVLLAGIVDSQWHAFFGLDETSWATPHALLWWGLFQASLGFLACRWALCEWRPMSQRTRAAFGFMVLVASITIAVGPFAHNNTPDTIGAIAALPQIQSIDSSHHLYRVYLAWDLSRTNPVFPILSAMAAGIGLTLLGGVVDRKALFLAVAVLVSLLTTANDLIVANHFGLAANPANWLPVPLVPAAAVLVFIEQRGLSNRFAMAGAGLTFGALWAIVWCGSPLGLIGAVAAGPAMVGGSLVGGRMWRFVERPTWGGTHRIILALAVVTPIVTGAVDLYIRMNTP